MAKKITEFDSEVSRTIQSGTTSLLFDRAAKEAITPGEKLEMIALKSLATGSQEDLFKEFGFDRKKVTFEAERFLGKQIKRDDDSSRNLLDKPPVVTENPFAKDLTDLSSEGALDFFN